MKGWMVALGIFGVIAAFALVCVVYVVSTLNHENRLRQAVIAKKTDNTSEFSYNFA